MGTVFEFLYTGECANAEIEGQFSHLVRAQEVWVDRIQGKNSSDEIFPIRSLDESWKVFEDYQSKLDEIANKPEVELEKVIHYQNQTGKEFETAICDILTQLYIHGQHHRAQIALLLRQNDITPPVTDYIYYCRFHS